jgi:hypothetical protein
VADGTAPPTGALADVDRRLADDGLGYRPNVPRGRALALIYVMAVALGLAVGFVTTEFDLPTVSVGGKQ